MTPSPAQPSRSFTNYVHEEEARMTPEERELLDAERRRLGGDNGQAGALVPAGPKPSGPSPAQVDAMREWLRANVETPAVIERYTPFGIQRLVADLYPGGVEQFIANHKEQG